MTWEGVCCVEKVNLKLGKLTAIVPESLRLCFNIVNRDTKLAGANLCIEEIPIIAKCCDCNAQSKISELPFICKECSSGDLDIISGRELIVTSIEVA
ncbi:MAG: hydrogenase maturation nickel metallochaperone HypA [Thermodesulfobacteriota bacterium]|nr:hydrogenase maturation nickel metallochaperone HypA [Thermodesulfobacteriota bacterium]